MAGALLEITVVHRFDKGLEQADLRDREESDRRALGRVRLVGCEERGGVRQIPAVLAGELAGRCGQPSVELMRGLTEEPVLGMSGEERGAPELKGHEEQYEHSRS